MTTAQGGKHIKDEYKMWPHPVSLMIILLRIRAVRLQRIPWEQNMGWF